MTTKERSLASINTVLTLEDYQGDDCIFSQKYGIPPVMMVYVLKQLAKDFHFAINDDFVDALEMCTFTQLEALLERYGQLQAA